MEHGILGLPRWSILINEGHWQPRNFDILIIEFLNYALQGRVSKILLGVPSRHGKSTLVSKNFASYFLAHFPDDNIILSSYSQQLASEFGRQVKDIINMYGHLSPYNVRLADDSKANNRFNIQKPYRGRMLSVGAAGSILGFGAGLFIIDDPIKSVAEAESKTLQRKLREWIGGTAKTRLEKRTNGLPPIMIVSAQRLHLKDLHGIIKETEPTISAKEALQILRNGGSIDPNVWVDLNLPAICEDPEQDLLGREVGDVLWPEQRSYDWLMAEKKAMGSYLFNAIYQGNPREREGKIFKRRWFYDENDNIHPHLISHDLEEYLNSIRYWDFASSEEEGDSAAGFKSSYDELNQKLVFRKLVHGKFSASGMYRKYVKTTILDSRKVVSIIEQEPGSHSKILISRFRKEKELKGYKIRKDKVQDSKANRAFDLEAMCENGDIQFDADNMTESEIRKAIDELIEFTGADGGEDNIVDTMTGSARYWMDWKNKSRTRVST